METTLFHTLIVGSLIGIAGGVLGSFALLRRMALVGDALSHVALPGLALGILFHFNPFIGATALLLFGTTLIWVIEHQTKLPVDTLVGVMFVVALAIGILLTPETELLEALFGNIKTVSLHNFWFASLLSIAMSAALLLLSKKLTLALISPELAKSVNLRPHLLEFIFLSIFALVVAIGIKLMGVLLLGALIIIPAAIARNISSSMRMYVGLSALLGVVGAVVGILLSSLFGFAPGPAFVLFLGTLFFISIFFKK